MRKDISAKIEISPFTFRINSTSLLIKEIISVLIDNIFYSENSLEN